MVLKIRISDFAESLRFRIFDYTSINDLSQITHTSLLTAFFSGHTRRIVSKQALVTLASNNRGSHGMKTPNSSVSGGLISRTNNNQASSGDNTNTGVNNVPPKKAVVSVQRPLQSNILQEQQKIPGASQMMFSASSIQYYPSDYLKQQGTPPSTELQQMSSYYSVNSSDLIQPAGGQSQHIMTPSASSSGGSATPGLPPLNYSRVDTATVNPTSVNQNRQLVSSSPQRPQLQQQSTGQQRGYGSGQNIGYQQTLSTGAANGGGSWLTQSYTSNDAIPTAYNYGKPIGWIPDPQQLSQQKPSYQMNGRRNVNVDSFQRLTPQQRQPTYINPNEYETFSTFPEHIQQKPLPRPRQRTNINENEYVTFSSNPEHIQQQPHPPQENFDTTEQDNYNH